jgi:glutathione S-transferase
MQLLDSEGKPYRLRQENVAMLELYHAEPAANSLKCMLYFKEKGLDFVSHPLNLAEFEQHNPAFVAINPNGQVPALVHDGVVITESTLINEYVEDVFPEPALRPADPVFRWRVRFWTKFVDEYFCPALSVLGWQRIIKPMIEHLTHEEFEAKVARIPLKEQQDKWRTAATQSFPQEQLDECARKVNVSLEKIEASLAENAWVVGPEYTLADKSCFAMMAGMPKYYGHFLNQVNTPNCVNWHARMMIARYPLRPVLP